MNKQVTTSTQDHLESLESLSDDFAKGRLALPIDYQYLS